MAKNPVKAVLFDLDGTLVDSETIASEATQKAFLEIMERPMTDGENAKLKGRPVKKILSEWFPDHGDKVYGTILSHFSTRISEIEPFEGIRELLQGLTSKGIRMAVVTSGQREVAEQLLAPSGLSSYFEFAVCQEDTERHKPDPEPLLLAAGKLGVSNEDCAYIGDQPYDMRAAGKAGMMALGAAWGPGDRNILEDNGAMAVFEKPDLVLEQILAVL